MRARAAAVAQSFDVERWRRDVAAALGAGRASDAAPLLDKTQALRWKLGGSHAQRQVFELAQAFAHASAGD